jgi:hypothetical protein
LGVTDQISKFYRYAKQALRLILAISPIDEATPDPLCTVGYGYQRIYRKNISMSRVGIDNRGRSCRLKINYRTSEQIRNFAQGILKGLEIDDLDVGIVTTVSDHSVFSGPEPIVERCVDEKKEAEAIVAWIQMLLEDHGFATYDPYKPTIRTALQSAGIASRELKSREKVPGPLETGIRMGTMKRIKGLEFRAVAMACAGASDPMNDLEEADIRACCERYVAATRAWEHLLVTVSTTRD